MKSFYVEIKDVRIVQLFDNLCADLAQLPQLSNNLQEDLKLKLECIEYGSISPDFAIAYRTLIGKHSSLFWSALKVNSDHMISLALKHAFRVLNGTDAELEIATNSISDIVRRNFGISSELLLTV